MLHVSEHLQTETRYIHVKAVNEYMEFELCLT